MLNMNKFRRKKSVAIAMAMTLALGVVGTYAVKNSKTDVKADNNDGTAYTIR